MSHEHRQHPERYYDQCEACQDEEGASWKPVDLAAVLAQIEADDASDR